jgi:fructose-1,6-bisphosphatase I
MELESSFMSFLLQHQQKHGRTLNFLILMERLVTAAKQIRAEYISGSLEENLGEAGQINVQGESVMAMDLHAHHIVVHNLKESDQVISLVSEETEDEISLNPDGRYYVYFDPLDGSSNIKHSLPVGFLFGIAKRNLDGPEDGHLRSGDELIASGMFLLPSGDFTFALRGAGTWRFLLDATNTYVRPTQISFPENEKTWELSWNAGNRHTFADSVQEWIAQNEKSYSFRYSGSLAVDFHRLLYNGGMFFYPAIVQHPEPEKNRPDGKLRLMYECNVVAMLAQEAGGYAVDENGDDILGIKPKDRHQRAAIYIGNRKVVESIAKVLKQN